MQRTLFALFLRQHTLLALLSLCVSSLSIAQELNNTEHGTNHTALTVATPYQPAHYTTAPKSTSLKPNVDQQQLPTEQKNTVASTGLAATKPINNKLNTEAKAMAHLRAMLRAKQKEASIKSVTPYQQLVKLAFKGKGANGINSYEDAAAVFCKQARDDNSAEAQFALGWMHANGKGFTKNENVAAFYYNKAAAQDHHRAKQSLIDFKGDEALAQTPACMLPDEPAVVEEVITATNTLAPAGSNGNEFYKRGPIFRMVDRLAPQYHIETDLAMAFIKTESNFNPRATSPRNAKGLMQLIPATAKRFHVKDPYNPEDNVKGGLAYLQWLMAYFEGDVRLVAAAYNAGEGAVNKYNGVPPYRETRAYVSKIYNLYRKSYHPFKQDMLVGKRSNVIKISSNP